MPNCGGGNIGNTWDTGSHAIHVCERESICVREIDSIHGAREKPRRCAESLLVPVKHSKLQGRVYRDVGCSAGCDMQKVGPGIARTDERSKIRGAPCDSCSSSMLVRGLRPSDPCPLRLWCSRDDHRLLDCGRVFVNV